MPPAHSTVSDVDSSSTGPYSLMDYGSWAGGMGQCLARFLSVPELQVRERRQSRGFHVSVRAILSPLGFKRTVI